VKKAISFLLLVIIYLSLVTPVWAVDWSSGCVANVRGVEIVTLKGIECIFSAVLNVITRLAGLAVFVMLIVGGGQYIMSGGDKQATEKARNTLTYAILGLVLVIGSWFILQFINPFTNVDVTNFVVVP